MRVRPIAQILKRVSFMLPASMILDRSQDERLKPWERRVVVWARRQVLRRGPTVKARRLRADGLSDQEILDRLSAERDPDHPLDARQLRRWFNEKLPEVEMIDGGGLTFVHAPDGSLAQVAVAKMECRECRRHAYGLVSALVRGTVDVGEDQALEIGTAPLSAVLTLFADPPPQATVSGYCQTCKARREWQALGVRPLRFAVYQEWQNAASFIARRNALAKGYAQTQVGNETP